MRTRDPDHPSPVRNMRSVYNTRCEKKIRSDAKGVTTNKDKKGTPVTVLSTKLHKLKKQQFPNPWRTHQSVFHEERGQCCWEKCPGIARAIADGAKRGGRSSTAMHCKECSAIKNKNIYLCNSNRIVEGPLMYCHYKYHCKKYLDVQEALTKKEKNYNAS